jgi:hypothetical protein
VQLVLQELAPHVYLKQLVDVAGVQAPRPSQNDVGV